MQVLLFRSRWGLRTRAVGEHPKAAETVGIDVIRLRYRNVILSGLLRWSGGCLSQPGIGNSFQDGMTDGRGFIALAAMIVGSLDADRCLWRGAAVRVIPGPSAGRSAFAPPAGELGDILSAIPPQFYVALPYLVTIIVLAGFVGRSIAAGGGWQAVRA